MTTMHTQQGMDWSKLDLVRNLVAKEIKVRYMGTFLGFAWALGNPLISIITYYLVFTYLLPTGQDRFALHLVTGIFHWMLFAQVIPQSCEWLTNNHHLLQKVRFPRLLLPISATLTVTVFWIAAMLMYCVLFPLLGGIATSALLWYPLVLVCFVIFIFGVGLLLSVLHARYRDIKPLVDVLVPLLFWLTPIVWFRSNLSADVQEIAAYNPVAPFFNALTAILHDGLSPESGDIWWCAGIALLALVAGLVTFHRNVDNLVDIL